MKAKAWADYGKILNLVQSLRLLGMIFLPVLLVQALVSKKPKEIHYPL